MGQAQLIIFIALSAIIFIVFVLGLLFLLMQYRKRKIIHEKEKQLIAFNSLLEGQELERARMAKDLHDGVGGILSSIKLNLSSMKGNVIIDESDALVFNKSLNQLDSAISEMRRVAHNMMPEALLKFGLKEALQDYCNSINESNTIQLKFVQVGALGVIDKAIGVAIYRIVQELISNTIKHAAAKNIIVQLSKNESTLTLVVEDDGIGFDTNTLAANKGTGLQNVRSRVEYLKGIFTIDSQMAKGTTLTIEIPHD